MNGFENWLDLFVARAKRAPNACAAAANDCEISYGQLESRSNQLARALKERGVQPRALVGVHLERGIELLVTLLGVLKAGCAYVPLDPTLPAARLGGMLNDAQPSLVVSTVAASQGFDLSETSVLLVDASRSELEALSNESSAVAIAPTDPAYVIFTSGSTGRPKGVAIHHGALGNYLRSMTKEPGLSPGEKNLALATFAFDMSILDFWLPLIVGAQVEIVSTDLGRDARRLKQRLDLGDIDFLHVTPTTLRMLIEAGWRGASHLRVLSGGEAMTRELADAVMERCGSLFNGYGPTETTVCATLWKVKPNDAISIGRCIDNTRAYVLDEEQRPVEVGEEGQLWIAGAGVAQGYIGRDDLTRERFVPDPFCPEGESRMYKTGDLVRQDLNGLYYFLGRADDQVKVRGYRIELGEIEDAIGSAPGAGASAVAVRHNPRTGEEQLVAFVAGVGAGVELDSLLSHARRRLPGYMVPTHIEQLDDLPRMPSGKLDRKSLPVPDFSVSTASSVPPGQDAELTGDLEESVADSFLDVLGDQEIHAQSDFFELGGTSLLAARLQLALEARLGREVTLGVIFEGKTVRGVAHQLSKAQGGESPRLLALRPTGANDPVFCVLGIHYYQELANHLAELDRPWYGAYLPLEQAFFERRTSAQQRGELLMTLASRYAQEIVKRRPSGPYCLLGHSTGGIIAFEIARWLLGQGHSVEKVVLLDTVLMNGVKRNAKHRVKQRLRAVRRYASREMLHWSGGQLERLGRHLELPDTVGKFVGFTQVEGDALHRMQVYEEAEKYWEKHLALPCEVDVVFVHAQRRCDPVGEVAHSAGWDSLVLGKLDILEVDREHADMVRAPHVHELAEVLQPLLR